MFFQWDDSGDDLNARCMQSGRCCRSFRPLYAASEGFVAKVLAKFGITYIDFQASASPEQINETLKKAKAKAARQGGEVPIYLESPGNPTNTLVDIEAVAAARDKWFDPERCPIAIDNTFLGPLWQRPLDHGADLVVYSLTKYVGGHSDLVAGSVSGKKKFVEAIRTLRNTMGGIADPNTAWMLLRSLETVELRMERAEKMQRKFVLSERPSKSRGARISRNDSRS